MDSLRAFINSKLKPLSQITFSGAGLHPLPVEVWERIFFLVGESCSPYNDSYHGIYHFSSQEDQRSQRQQHEPTTSINGDLFHTRLSLVLVCQSWYCVGIRILLSHVIFGGKDPNKRAASFFKTLKRSSTMGTFITQVTIDTEKSHKIIKAVPEIAKWLPRLPNLVHLRLRVTRQEVIWWTSSTWVLPALKSLSIHISDNVLCSEWVFLLKCTQKTIENLQISSNLDFSGESDLIDVPRLKEIYIIHPNEEFKKPQKEWYTAITASRLEKIVISPKNPWAYSRRCIESIISMIDLARINLPSIKRVYLITCDDQWEPLFYERHQFVRRTKDIVRWCRSGLEVKIISKDMTWVYTKELFSEDQFEYWERMRFF